MKKGMIEIERFIASCIIFAYHIDVIKSGWVFVEFFFVLTGFFLTNHLSVHKNAVEANAVWYPLKYTAKKYISVFPYTSLSIIAMCIFYIDVWKLSGIGVVKWLLYLPSELLLLGASGMQPYGYLFWSDIATPRMMNVLLWYVSSMLIVMPIVCYLLINHKRSRGILCTVVPAILYGFLIMKDGSVNGWHDETFGFIYCNIRAMAGILTGVGTWHLSGLWNRYCCTKFGKKVLTYIEVLSFIAVIGISSMEAAHYDSLVIGLFVISISLTGSSVTYTSDIKSRIFDVLGSWSLAIYCLHKPIISFWMRYFENVPFNLLMLFVVTIGLSAWFTWFIKKLKNV